MTNTEEPRQGELARRAEDADPPARTATSNACWRCSPTTRR